MSKPFSKQSDWDGYVETLKNHSHQSIFISSRFDHIRYLKGDGSAAIVLAYLLNLLNMKMSNKKDMHVLRKSEFLFRCPAKKIQQDLGMGENRQRTAITNLVKAGILKTQRKLGNILWIHVIAEKLKMIEEWDKEEKKAFQKNPETGNPRNRNGEPPEQKRGTPVSYIDKNSEEELRGETDAEIPRPKPTPKTLFSGNIPDFCLTWAKELRRILRSKSPPLPVGMGAEAKWAEEFAVLYRLCRKDRTRIQELLDWYAENINDVSRPTIKNAKQFRQQFSWLEDLMNKAIEEKQRNDNIC